MKKIISILACVCLLLSAMVIPVSAADGVTITFDNTSKRTVGTEEQQVWEENGITVTNNQAASTSKVNLSYYNPVRFYKSSDVIIEYPNMITIVVNANTAAYATALVNSCTVGTATASGKAVTIVLNEATDSYTVSLTGGQVRVDSITVYAVEEGGCTHAETTIASNGDETHSVVCDICGETIRTADCEDGDLDGACDTCEGDVALPETLTIVEAIELGAAQATSAYTADKYFVTGQITAIANTTYGNIYIADEDGNEIYIYGLYNNDGTVRFDALDAKPDEGDTVTVLSTVGNYNGTPQLKNAWLIEFTDGELEPTTPDPEADSELTIEEAIALGESKKSNIYTENKYYVTGTITEVYNEDYGNMYIADENGNTLTVYGTYSADGSTRYADMETKPVAGDTVTIYGVIGNYNGDAQIKNGWITEIIVGTPEETVPGLDPEAPIELAVNSTTPATLTEVVVPAGATVFMKAADATGILHVTSADGSYMLINGMQNQVTADAETDLVLCGYEMVNVYNPSETDTITLYVFLEAGAGAAVGTIDNPEVLELQANPMMPQFPPSAQATTELEGGNEGYFYKIVATEDGAFSITISAYDAEYNTLGYQFNATNNTTSVQSDYIARAADAEDYYDSVMVFVSAGDEVIINANTFDAANVWNAPAGTLNVNIGFAAVGSQSNPAVLDTVGDYKATVSEGSQGYYYEYVVTADGKITVIMNDEAGWQYSVSKVPADENDYANYYSGETHYYNDETVVASETVEVTVGETVKVWVNTFDPANEWTPPAGTVNWTLDFAQEGAPGKFKIDDVDAVAGEEFTVTVDIRNNPGIIGAKLNINYDADILELVSATAGDFTNDSINVDGTDLYNYNFGPLTDNPFVINWVDALATENTTTNGTFATLTFKVKDTAVAGTTEISITFEEDDITDKDLNNVAFEAVNATVTIAAPDVTPGDANGDGKVNGRDYGLLMQHINGWDVTIDLDAADVTGDGKVNGRDYGLLMQYINGWDVDLK